VRLLAHAAVDPFAEEVGVPVVSRVLDHVDHHIPEHVAVLTDGVLVGVRPSRQARTSSTTSAKWQALAPTTRVCHTSW
jgi:hypothetical protein